MNKIKEAGIKSMSPNSGGREVDCLREFGFIIKIILYTFVIIKTSCLIAPVYFGEESPGNTERRTS